MGFKVLRAAILWILLFEIRHGAPDGIQDASVSPKRRDVNLRQADIRLAVLELIHFISSEWYIILFHVT
jgi:hypothetical protein